MLKENNKEQKRKLENLIDKRTISQRITWYESNEKSKVINFYGTTETAIISHYYEIPKSLCT